MPRNALQSIYVLHRRPYKNTSLLVNAWARDVGIVTMIARSARGPKSRFRGLLQPFYPLLASFSGRGELAYLNQLEMSGQPLILHDNALWSAFYLNELCLRLLSQQDHIPDTLFECYANTLSLLNQGTIEPALRIFEKNLLSALGYGLPLEREAKNNQEIQADVQYLYQVDVGFNRCDYAADPRYVFLGESLMALQTEQLIKVTHLKDVKRLLRIAIAPHLQGRPLHTRRLMAQLHESA